MPATAWPVAADFTLEGGPGGGTTTETAETSLRNWLEQCRRLPGADGWTLHAIAGNAVTPSRAMVSLEIEGVGATPPATADDLTHILTTNVQPGQMIWLRAQSSARTISLKRLSAGGNLDLKTETFTITTVNDNILLFLRADLVWEELVRHYDWNSAEGRSYLNLKGAAQYEVANNLIALAGTAADHLTRVDQIGPMLYSYPVSFTGRPALATPALTDRLILGRPAAGAAAASVGYATVGDVVGLSQPKEFGEFAIGNGLGGEVLHTLGARPTRVEAYYRCKNTGEYGLGVGEETKAQAMYVSGNSRGVGISVDASKIYYRFTDQAQPAAAFDLATGQTRLLTNDYWVLVIRAQR